MRKIVDLGNKTIIPYGRVLFAVIYRFFYGNKKYIL